MEEGESLSINISHHGQWGNEKPSKRNSMSKKEWLQLKRQKKRSLRDEESREAEEPVVPASVKHDVKTSDSDQSKKSRTPASAKPRHVDNKATASKFSALFTKNPDIPSFKSAAVTSLSEKVFTGDSFKDLELHTFMVDNLEKKFGFEQMTTVQKASIPHIMQGRDVLIKSQTGSGKTLAYAVPIVQQLQGRSPKISRADGTFALVIVPTRELAIQSCNTFTKLTRPFTWVVPGSLMGGEKRKAEKARLRKGISVLVSTPGRLLDHVKHTHSLQLDRISWLVIDEADRLLDMGFEKDVREIINCLDEKQTQHRQTILLSATLSTGVEQLAGMSLHDPLRISVSQDSVRLTAVNQDVNSKDSTDVTEPERGSSATSQTHEGDPEVTSEQFATPSSLEHQCVVVPSKLRLVTLAAFLLDKCKFSRRPVKMVVFFSTQDLVEFHHLVFSKCLCEVDEQTTIDEQDAPGWLFKLHGDMEQKTRTKVFQDFQEAKSGVLLSTDVASRGLDLPHVQWIVQFQAPASPADYIHRAGRTARAGTQGHALIFLTPAEVDFVNILNDHNINLKTVDMQTLLGSLKKKVLPLLGSSLPKTQIPRTTEQSAIALQRKMETFVDGQSETRALARKAYQSFVRAYAAYPTTMRQIFNLKKVHLGHVAKSFCLAEAPSTIGSIVGAQAASNKRHKRKALFDGDDAPKKKTKLQKQRLRSEFDSGLEGVNACAIPKKFKKGNQVKKKKIKIR